MKLPVNDFKRGLFGGNSLLGLWLGLANPYTAELCANAGFDWLLIDGEHAPNDLRSILAQLQAVAPYPSHPVVRPPVGDPVLIKQLLDIGAQTLLVPMVETAGQARALVEAMRYPPHGIRGVGSSLARASRWGKVPGYLKEAEAELCLLAQIESTRGLENLEAIAAVEGVDGIFIGPADLGASLGHLGDSGHAEVQEHIDAVLAVLHKLGKPTGILATDRTRASRYVAAGVNFVAVGVDTSILTRGLADVISGFRAPV